MLVTLVSWTDLHLLLAPDSPCKECPMESRVISNVHTRRTNSAASVRRGMHQYVVELCSPCGAFWSF